MGIQKENKNGNENEFGIGDGVYISGKLLLFGFNWDDMDVMAMVMVMCCIIKFYSSSPANNIVKRLGISAIPLKSPSSPLSQPANPT